MVKAFGLLIAISFLISSSAMAADKLNLTVDWVIYAPHTYFISAKKLGYYKKAGLDVTINRGFGSTDTIKKVGVGQADFGQADTGSLIVARTKGIKVKELGVTYARAPYELACLKKKGITKAKDIEGKIMGTNQGTSVYTLFPAFARAAGVDQSKVKWAFIQPSAIIPSLVSGKIDCAFVYANNRPIAVNNVRKAGGGEVSVLAYADHGVDIYANGIITQDERIAKNPDQVRKFVEASFKGVAWVVENPKKGLDNIMEHSPSLNRQNNKEGLVVTLDLLLTKEAKEKGIGFMSREKVKRTRDITSKYMKLKQTVPVDDIYTMKFLPKLFPKRGNL
jgi:NitT/TauT family transport system substrate-binding protein